MASDSDSYVPTQKAVVTYVNAQGFLTSADAVTSFNTRTGSVTLTSGDVTTALGYTPFNSANVSTDGTMADNSTTEVPSQSAVVTYVASELSSYVSSTHIQRGTFTDGDLVSGNVLVITHNLALTAPFAVVVAVFDNNGNQVLPDAIVGATNSVDVDLSSYGSLTGTWGWVIVG